MVSNKGSMLPWYHTFWYIWIEKKMYHSIVLLPPHEWCYSIYDWAHEGYFNAMHSTLYCNIVFHLQVHNTPGFNWSDYSDEYPCGVIMFMFCEISQIFMVNFHVSFLVSVSDEGLENTLSIRVAPLLLFILTDVVLGKTLRENIVSK